MSSIIRLGDTFHGISVSGRGVLKDEYGTRTYAGQCKDGYACGLGVATCSDGHKDYAEHSPDGKYDGRYLLCWTDGEAKSYGLYERGKEKEYAVVFADGYCYYNGVDCARDYPRLLALIAQVAPVEVRPAAPALNPLLGPPLAPQAIVRWISLLVLPPAGAREGHSHRGDPHAARQPWWPCDTTQ